MIMNTIHDFERKTLESKTSSFSTGIVCHQQDCIRVQRQPILLAHELKLHDICAYLLTNLHIR